MGGWLGMDLRLPVRIFCRYHVLTSKAMVMFAGQRPRKMLGRALNRTPARMCRRGICWGYAALMLPSFTWNKAACGSALRSSSAMCGWQVK